jgi:hypothetical protein
LRNQVAAASMSISTKSAGLDAEVFVDVLPTRLGAAKRSWDFPGFQSGEEIARLMIS